MLDQRTRHRSAVRWVTSAFGDIRFAFRHFARTPLATGTLVLVLAIGIGAHAAVFAFVQAVTTRPVAGIPANPSLVRIRGTEEHDTLSRDKYPRGLSYPELIDIEGHATEFASIAGWTVSAVTLAVDSGVAVHAGTAHFTMANLFRTLGIQVARGVELDSVAGGAMPTAVIGDQLWHELFAASENVIGRALRVNNTTVRIVGVAPPHFQGPVGPEGERAIWLRIDARQRILDAGEGALASRDSLLFNAVGRLGRGASLTDANQVVATTMQQSVGQITPVRGTFHRSGDVVLLRGSTTLPRFLSQDAFFIKYGASVALLILVLVCINVSALQVGAARARRQEIAIRISLGASRGRVVRQLLTESIVVAILGGTVGLALYVGLIHWFGATNGTLQLNPDFGTAIYTALFAAGTGVLFGLAPALHATTVAPGEVMKDGGRATSRRSRLQERFIVAQVALTQPCLLAIGIMLTQVVLPGVGARMPGVIGDHVVRLDPSWWTAGENWKESVPSVTKAMNRIRGAPGILAVSSLSRDRDVSPVSTLPEDPRSTSRRVVATRAEYRTIQPGYLAMLGVQVPDGREFTAADSLLVDEPVILSAEFAHRLFGTERAVGKRIELRLRRSPRGDHGIVVGVMEQRNMGSLPPLLDFAVLERGTNLVGSYLVRTVGPAEAAIPQIDGMLRAAAPRVAFAVHTLANIESAAIAQTFWIGSFALGCGLIALLLCSLGLYAIVALSVGHHRREIGIRMALGARPGQVVWIFLRRGLQLGTRGIVYGLPLSVAGFLVVAPLQAWRVSLLAGGGVGLIVLAIATIASWVPAHQAAAVQPTEAMRGS